MTLRELLERAWPRKQSYSLDVIFTFAANIVTAALGLGSGVLLARVLGPEGRGEIAAIQALPLIVGSVGMLGLQDSIVYFGARRREKVGEYAVSATLLICLIGVPIVFAAYWLVPTYLQQHTAEIVWASRIYLSILFLHALMGFSVFTVRAVHDMRLWNVLRVLPQTTWLLVIVALVVLGRATPLSVPLTYLAAFLVLSLVSLLAVRGPLRQGWGVRTSLWPKMLRYALPLAAGSTPQIVGERADQLIVAALLPAEELGYYVMGVAWSVMILLPGAALFSSAFSKIAGMTQATEQWRFIKKVSLAVIAVSIPAGVVLIAAAPYMIPLLFGEDFAPAVPCAMILVVAAGIRNVARVLQVSLMGTGQPKGIMFSEVGGLITLLIAIFLLVPSFGLLGAAYSVVLSSVAASGIAFVRLRAWAAGIGRDGAA